MKPLIGKIDDYVNEIGETQRAFGNYDEFYVLEFDSIKARLVDECQRRGICKGSCKTNNCRKSLLGK